RVFDKEVLQILFELLLEKVFFQFLKASCPTPREGVPFRVKSLELLLLFRERARGAGARASEGRIAVASLPAIALSGLQSGSKRGHILGLRERFDQRVDAQGAKHPEPPVSRHQNESNEQAEPQYRKQHLETQGPSSPGFPYLNCLRARLARSE